MNVEIKRTLQLRLTLAPTILGLLLLALSIGSVFAQQTHDSQLEDARRFYSQYLDLYKAGRYAEAISLARKALELYEKALGTENPDVAATLNNLALLYKAAGDYGSALPLYERVLRIEERLLGWDHPDIAVSLNNLAALLRTQGDYNGARPLYERALKIKEKALGPSHPDVAVSLNSLALLHKERGEYVTARLVYERALNILENALGPDHLDVATVHNNLASLLQDQGDYASARRLYERVLKIREKVLGPAHRDVAVSLNNLASLLRTEGDYAGAQALYERALRISETTLGPNHPAVATSLNNLALLLYTQGDSIAARPLYERALEIGEKALGGDHPSVAISLNNLAEVQKAQGDYTGARSLYERALRIKENTLGPNHPSVASSLNNLAFLDWTEKDVARARPTFLKAAAIIQGHVQGLFSSLSFAEQRAFLDSEIPGQIGVLLSSSREGEVLQSAYELLFRWKGLLVESLRRQTAFSQMGEDSKFKQQVQRVQALRAQIAGWYHKAGSVSLGERNQKNDTLMREKEALERELFGATKPGALEDPMGNVDLQRFRSILKSGEVFVDVYRYPHWEKRKDVEERYAAVVTASTGGPILVDLGSSRTVDQAVNRWRVDALSRQPGESSWQALVALVWKPLAGTLPKGTRKVWLSPDRELSRIPWHLLPPTEPGRHRPLLSQTNSARELVSLRRRVSIPIPTAQRALLLVGGIDFNAGASIDTPQVFEPLPETAEEVNALHSLARKQRITTTLMTGSEGTKGAVKSHLPAAFYAHLATHGFFSKELGGVRNPLVESGLALAGANVRDPSTQEAKGLLTAEELVGFDLSRTEMVVLSACNTGRGQEVTGQGVMGLRASVMAAGARGLLMSLWKVPDKPTAKLMEAFYTNIWIKKLSKAEALTRAQQATRDDPSGKFKSQWFWAAWVLVGEGW